MVSFARQLAFLSLCRPSPPPSPSSLLATRRIAASRIASAAATAGFASLAAASSSSSPARARGLDPTSASCAAAAAAPHPSSSSSSAAGRRTAMSASSSSSSTSPPSSSAETIPSAGPDDTGYLNAIDAANLDVELMSTPGFSVEQLMELAGLSVAEAVYASVPPPPPGVGGTDGRKKKKKVLIVCGPGNNGGDGLVAARHLVLFGYDVDVSYPNKKKREHYPYVNLIRQCEDVGIPILDDVPPPPPDDDGDGVGRYDAVVDAVFGFSFKGEPREPFATALKRMSAMQSERGSIVISVDVPSGWDVNEGDVKGTGFVPDVLVSLTAPKLSSLKFGGRHFVGGRFLPPKLAEKYGIRMPPYPGVSQVMEISGGASTSTTPKQSVDEDWAVQYARHMAEKEAKEFGGGGECDAGNEGKSASSSGTPAKGDDEWAAEYSKYLAEKEKKLLDEEGTKK